MKLRSEFARRLPPCALLVAALVFVGYSAGWAQSLTPTAQPAVGAAGLKSSRLTGHGFPDGAITGATVHFGTGCAAPAVATAPVIEVTAHGAVRRFEFMIPASLAPGRYKVWVSGNAGATAFNTVSTSNCSTLTVRAGVQASVQGTASLGAAIGDAAVTLVDAAGNSRTGTTASDGTFALRSEGLVPPFLVRVVTATPSGSFPAGTTLYSVSADGSASTHINVHVLTDLMVRSFYSAQGLNPDNAFTSPVGANAAPTPSAVQLLADLVIPAVQLWLSNAGVEATGDAPSNGAINLISSPFIAYPPGVTPTTGLDAVLHQITSELVNPADGSISAMTITDGNITETVTPVYSNGLITLNTATTDAATGGGSTGSFSALALTSALQPVFDGITAWLTGFRNTVNTRGAALTGSDLLPFFAANYLDNGNNATRDADNLAEELAGITINRFRIKQIKSVNANVADVVVSYAIGANGQFETGDVEFFFTEIGSTWLLYGNQRIAEVGVGVQSRTHHGSAGSLGPGVFSGTVVFAGVTSTQGVVTGGIVSGPVENPAANIWNGAASGPLFQQAQILENGQAFDNFVRLSQPLGSTLSSVTGKVMPGHHFTFDLTTAASGTFHYTVKVDSVAFTTEALNFIGVPPSGPLSSVVGNTVTYNFTLPKTFTYTASSVFLFAYIYDGPPNNPAAHSCSIGADGPLTLDFGPGTTYTGSGSITFPANMSACGLNPSVPIAVVDVFLQVEGSLGEDSLVQWRYPY